MPTCRQADGVGPVPDVHWLYWLTDGIAMGLFYSARDFYRRVISAAFTRFRSFFISSLLASRHVQRVSGWRGCGQARATVSVPCHVERSLLFLHRRARFANVSLYQNVASAFIANARLSFLT